MKTIQSMGMDERISIIREGRNILHECRNGKIRAVVMQTTDGRYYAFMLSSEGTGNAVFRRTSDMKKILTVYRRIEQHIKNDDRTYDELTWMLNSI